MVSAAAATCTVFVLGQQQDALAQEDKSFYQSIKDSVFGESFEEPEYLIPASNPDQWGQIPRTLVLDFGGTICFPLWTRDGGWLVRKRPYCDELLHKAFLSSFELVIWSSGSQHTDEQNVQDFDMYGMCRQRLFRDNNTMQGFRMVKDLNKLGRDLNRLIVVESNPSRVYPSENVLKVSEFKDDINDQDLKRVMHFIADVQRYNVHDVRPFIKRFNESPPGTDVFQEERNKLEVAHRQLSKQVGVTQTSSGSWFGSLFNMLRGNSTKNMKSQQN